MAKNSHHVRISEQHHKDIIERKLNTGQYATISDVLRAGLDLLGSDEQIESAVSSTAVLQGNSLVVTVKVDLKNL